MPMLLYHPKELACHLSSYLLHLEDPADGKGVCFDIGLVGHGGLNILVPTLVMNAEVRTF